MAVAATGQVMRLNIRTSFAARMMLLMMMILMMIFQPSEGRAASADRSCKTVSVTLTASITAHTRHKPLYTVT